MSVLCCRVPDFLTTLTLRQYPELAEKPFILAGSDGSIWAASRLARQSGVYTQMPLRRALAHCPDALVQELDLQAGQQTQEAMLATLTEWRLPVEPLGWGLAYVDLHTVATTQDDVRLLAADLGRNVRQMLGDDLQPALGWDSGKFTARAAAIHAPPGHMKLVPKQQEVGFLSTLPITVLPLPPAALQQLHWLGIQTLDQYARLPATAVWQRFGRMGKLAQRWAQGRDNRPVRAGEVTGSTAIEIDIDPPTGLLPPAVEAIMAALQPGLQQAGDRLRGWRRLQFEIQFVDGSRRQLDLAFASATAEFERVRASLTSRLAALNWPDEASAVCVRVLEEADLPIQQLTLLPEPDEQTASMQRRIASLAGKYGPVFLQGTIVEPGHPAAGRRFALEPMSGEPIL